MHGPIYKVNGWTWDILWPTSKPCIRFPSTAEKLRLCVCSCLSCAVTCDFHYWYTLQVKCTLWLVYYQFGFIIFESNAFEPFCLQTWNSSGHDYLICAKFLTWHYRKVIVWMVGVKNCTCTLHMQMYCYILWGWCLAAFKVFTELSIRHLVEEFCPTLSWLYHHGGLAFFMT